MDSSYYPPVNFFFVVSLDGQTKGPDARFKEATGLSVKFTTQEFGEGGENRFKHTVPGIPQYDNLVLKRGFVVKGLPFHEWCMGSLQGNFASPIELKTVQVVLRNEKAQPLKTWDLHNAWPVKWNVSSFNSMDGQVVIEEMELSYQYFMMR